MAATLSPVPKLQFFDANGAPLAGGKLYSYFAGTTTPQSTYTDSTGTTSNPNPVILDARGEAGVWLANDAFYKLSLYTSTNVLVWTVDQIASNTTLAALAASGGSALVGYLPAGTGAVATTVQTKLRESVSVTDYGADPTGVTDSTTTIQAAIDAALAAGKQIVAQGTFRISAKVVIKGDTDFSQATFNVYGAPAIALEVSTGNAANPTTILYSSVIWLPKRINNMTKPATGWAGQGIGVRTVNTYGCQIFVGTINNFQTGFFPTSYNTGNVFNTYFLGILENNQQNLRLEPGNATSWVNNNTFIGGACSFYSAEGSNVSGCYDINIQQFAGGLGPPNNNLFINTSIEADTPEFHILCAGSFNTFQQLRFEATTPKVRFTGTSGNNGTRNMILGGYTLESVVVSYSGTTGKNNVLFGGGTEVFEMGTSAKPLRFQNISSSGSDISRIYEAGLDPWANGADWSVAESAQYLYAKRSADAQPRLWLDYVNARMYVGTGAVAPTAYIGAFGASTLGCSASVWPTTDNTRTLGDASFRWSDAYLSKVQLSVAATSGAAGTVTLGATTATTVGAAGAASALPANPLGYLIAYVAGTQVKIPYYTA